MIALRDYSMPHLVAMGSKGDGTTRAFVVLLTLSHRRTRLIGLSPALLADTLWENKQVTSDASTVSSLKRLLTQAGTTETPWHNTNQVMHYLSTVCSKESIRAKKGPRTASIFCAVWAREAILSLATMLGFLGDPSTMAIELQPLEELLPFGRDANEINAAMGQALESDEVAEAVCKAHNRSSSAGRFYIHAFRTALAKIDPRGPVRYQVLATDAVEEFLFWAGDECARARWS